MCSIFNARMSEIWKVFPLLNTDDTNSLFHVQTNTAFSSVDNSFQAPIAIIPRTTETLITPPLPLHTEISRTSFQTFNLETSDLPGKGHTIADGQGYITH